MNVNTPEPGRARGARAPRSPAVVTAYKAAAVPQWRYEASLNAPFPIRTVPDVNGPKSGSSLKPGEVFSVSGQRRSSVDAVLYLKLADGRGWVFDKIPSFAPVIVPHSDEDSIFDLDDACEDLLDDGLAQRDASRARSIQARTPSRKPPGLFSAFQGCWSCTGCDTAPFQPEPEVGQTQLLVEKEVIPLTPHMLGVKDALDITFTPRSERCLAQTFTPRQLDFKEQIELPEMQEVPLPPNCGLDESEEVVRSKLLEMYREFAVDLHTGVYLTQLMSNLQEHADIHCQLIDDMTTLRLDQSSGFLYEFPLTDVSRVFPIDLPGTTDHVVFVQFFRRKIAFVFKDKEAALRFTMCIDLLTLRAQQKRDAPQEVAKARAPFQGWNAGTPAKSPVQSFRSLLATPVTPRRSDAAAPLRDLDFPSQREQALAHEEKEQVQEQAPYESGNSLAPSLERVPSQETYDV